MSFLEKLALADFKRWEAAATKAIEEAECAYQPWKRVHESGPSLSEILDDPKNPEWKRLEQDPDNQFANRLFSILADAQHLRFEVITEWARVAARPKNSTTLWLALAHRCHQAKKLAEKVVVLASGHPPPG
jgi:hypothetical protein